MHLYNIDSYTRKKTKYAMEIKRLTDMTKSLDTHVNEAYKQIAEYDMRFVQVLDRIETLDKEISKM